MTGMSYGLVGDRDTPLSEQIFHISKTQRKSIMQGKERPFERSLPGESSPHTARAFQEPVT